MMSAAAAMTSLERTKAVYARRRAANSCINGDSVAIVFGRRYPIVKFELERRAVVIVDDAGNLVEYLEESVLVRGHGKATQGGRCARCWLSKLKGERQRRRDKKRAKEQRARAEAAASPALPRAVARFKKRGTDG